MFVCEFVLENVCHIVCYVFVHNDNKNTIFVIEHICHTHDRIKLDPCTLKTIFIGHSPTQKGYQCYCPKNKKKLSLVMLLSLKILLISLQFCFRGEIRIKKLVVRGYSWLAIAQSRYHHSHIKVNPNQHANKLAKCSKKRSTI